MKIANLIAISSSIKNTRIVIYYNYEKFDYLKENYLDKDKE